MKNPELEDAGAFIDGMTPSRPSLERFVSGRGKYVADLRLPRMAHAAFARSSVPHGVIRRLDVGTARQMPGVLCVLVGDDIAHFKPTPSVYERPGQNYSDLLALARGKVFYVGQAVAVVVATSRDAAARACLAIEAEIEPLAAVTSIDAALRPDAPRLYPQWPDNVIARAHWRLGDPQSAMAGAAVVVERTFESPRVHPLPLEPRGLLAEPGPEPGSVRLHTSTQSVHQLRRQIVHSLGWAEHRLQVVCHDVGGGFGLKMWAYAEDALIVHLAHELQRPVRWIESRRESFACSWHGRGQRIHLKAGFAPDGKIESLVAEIQLDKGADSGPGAIGTALFAAGCLPGLYALEAVEIATLGVVTNKTPTGAYRGYGQPEVNFALERLLDMAAAQLGIDVVDIRRRNLVRAELLPCPSATGVILDSGDYRHLLDLTVEKFGFAQAQADAASARAAGRLVGVGLSTYADLTNLGPASGLARRFLTSGGFDTTTVRMEPTGHVRVFTGQIPMGQGVEFALAQTCASELGIPVADVVVVFGDSNLPFSSFGTGASRGAGVGGSSVLLATRQLVVRLKAWAAEILEATVEELELGGGTVRVAAQPARSVTLARIAHMAYVGTDRPQGIEPGLQETTAYDPAGQAASYGMVACVVEVDAGTGSVQLKRLMLAHDCGVQINPQIVHGQIQGGAVQGVGSSLFEEMLHDDDGMLLTWSLHDYTMPMAADLPAIDILHTSTPAPFAANGAKGAGESGVVGVPAAIANAVQDAIGARGIVDRLPLGCERVLALIHSGGRAHD